MQQSWVQSQHPSHIGILGAADEAVLNKVHILPYRCADLLKIFVHEWTCFCNLCFILRFLFAGYYCMQIRRASCARAGSYILDFFLL
jgi:hypothetical protein